MQSSHFLISAPSSNSGKTTLTLGLLRALKNRGLSVQPFKCGPDYIDTQHHTTASGNPGINMDTFMASEAHVRDIYEQYSETADVSVTEGVMGLFDGADKMKGSSAAIAELLDIPVILVINAKSMAYSAAPLLYGFKNFYNKIRVVGAIFNFVSTASHYRFLQEACEEVGIEALGYLPKNEALSIPSRHLGLHISAETDYEIIIEKLAEEIPKTINIDRLLEISTREILPKTESIAVSKNPVLAKKYKIAIARDEAFTFTYHQNIEVLSSFGEVTFFSPMHDKILPETDFLYLPGGYPELFGKVLRANKSMLESIQSYCFKGGLTFAECGGLMYLGNEIITSEGINFRMTGILDCTTSMENSKLTLGYRIVQWNNLEMKGHEFHYSRFVKNTLRAESVIIKNAKGIEVETQLFRKLNTFASYVHLYWGENRSFIEYLLENFTQSR
ncbi:cobyrinate a,c-diamide synthase [Dyadobacter frigoris]|uniref:Cobyrinate a,c-diamide synthase n=1 Tax=Dyadobacter frigoris TaxID=2576211 RepID=A0A4U6D9V5_9BACT|nr:cobyrinate a,c-diamide synthase [Dyadobacter frigoris]TKT94269.1 cobyrinate a,c-diamide synthase [Dyadobacter frigoris]GLU50541.1 cobyrinic acid a,c-diamide synthase [Dyadobacter frigoris]